MYAGSDKSVTPIETERKVENQDNTVITDRTSNIN